MKKLEEAGASAITGTIICWRTFSQFYSPWFHDIVHLRQRATREREPANWTALQRLVSAVSIPVNANGDFYDPTDILNTILNTGCAGIMLARPLLLNPSLLLFRERTICDGKAVYRIRHDRYLTLQDTIIEYLRMCVIYDHPYQVM